MTIRTKQTEIMNLEITVVNESSAVQCFDDCRQPFCYESLVQLFNVVDEMMMLLVMIMTVMYILCVRANRWLLAHGDSRQTIAALLEHSCRAVSPVPSLVTLAISPTSVTEAPRDDDQETAWLVDCNRSEAERILVGKPEGTFLIRPSSDPQSFAMSIKYVF